MEKIKIILVMDKYRPSDYTRDLIPAFMEYIGANYPEAEFELVIQMATDSSSDDINIDWSLSVFAPLPFDEQEQLKERLNNDLIEIDTGIWVQYAIPKI